MKCRHHHIWAAFFVVLASSASVVLLHIVRSETVAGPVVVTSDNALLGIPVDPAIADTVRRFLDTWTTPAPLDQRRSNLRALATGDWVDACAADDPQDVPSGRLVAVTGRIDRPNPDGTPAGVEL